jgi:hypothetical protein
LTSESRDTDWYPKVQYNYNSLKLISGSEVASAGRERRLEGDAIRATYR